MRYKLSGILLVAVLSFVFVAIGPIGAVEFDWRGYPGGVNLPAGNYVTPVRDQGNAGTCWAFAAVGAVEAKYDITFKLTNSTLNLSEQHLVCDGSTGDIDGGWEDAALKFIRDHGIVDEAKLPYTAKNTSPKWPLQQPYTLYRITSVQTRVSCDPTVLKTFLQNNGPVAAAINSGKDFITPPHSLDDSTSALVSAGDNEVPPGVQMDARLVPDAHGASLDHAVVITGFTDNASVAGGGYWHIKNSWGSTWGPTHDGYGYVTYATMLVDNYVTGIPGVAYTQTVPEPSAIILLGTAAIGLLALARRRRRS